MVFPSRLLRGELIQRYKRFLADVRLRDGRVVTAHCVNTGSMMGCNEPGSPVYLSTSQNPKRRLAYTWELVKVGRTWVGINTLVPNRLVAEAIESGVIRELQGYPRIQREVKVRTGTRLDLCLQQAGRRYFVEVKNVTLSLHGVAAFPDAITERGTKHLRELIRLRRKGDGAAVVFVVQRGDCDVFRPADEIDSEYGKWLRRAFQAGVKVLPYRAKVNSREIVIAKRLSLEL